jgi:hypothetical protein
MLSVTTAALLPLATAHNPSPPKAHTQPPELAAAWELWNCFDTARLRFIVVNECGSF